MFVSFILLLLLSHIIQSNGFSANSISNHIKSIIIDRLPGDATAIPFDKIPDTELMSVGAISYSSDFLSANTLTISAYNEFTCARNKECINLFDGYETHLLRCEILDETSLNVRWTAEWMPSGSAWLYDLADFMGWDVTRKSPDPMTISTFSWESVYDTFQKAFATGEITLPISCVEGSTLVFISGESPDDPAGTRVKLKELIDLVAEADKSRLQNRRVAQELACWLDVRRPPEGAIISIDADEWAGIVRQRILAGVPEAGALDVDPNADNEAGIAVSIFGAVCLASLALSFQYFVAPEIVGGMGEVPSNVMM